MTESPRYRPRSISFLGRDGRLKHYGIGTHDRLRRPALAEATRAEAMKMRRAWLEDVLKAGDNERYQERNLADVVI